MPNSSAETHDTFTILHISDFHFTKRKKRDQELVVDALLRDLQDNCVGYRKPDLLMFTGDLVHAGGIDLHDEAYDELLSKVSAAVGLSDERVFVAPGNHDVDTSVVDQHVVNHEEWRLASNDQKKLNELYDQGAFDNIVKAKLASYKGLADYLSRDTMIASNLFGEVHHLVDLRLDIILMNTSAMSKGGSKSLSRDEGFMAIPEYAIIDLLSHLKAELCIAVTHHPLSALSEGTARLLRQKLQAHANIHLYGHMHDPVSENIQGALGSVYTSQAGQYIRTGQTTITVTQ